MAKTTEALNYWIRETLPKHDVAILLSGTEFTGSRVGLAYVGSMCARVHRNLNPR